MSNWQTNPKGWAKREGTSLAGISWMAIVSNANGDYEAELLVLDDRDYRCLFITDGLLNEGQAKHILDQIIRLQGFGE